MDNVHKYNICTNVPSSLTFRSYLVIYCTWYVVCFDNFSPCVILCGDFWLVQAFGKNNMWLSDNSNPWAILISVFRVVHIQHYVRHCFNQTVYLRWLNIVTIYVRDYRYGNVDEEWIFNHIYTSLGTTSNYSATANFYSSQITTAPTKPLASLLSSSAVPWQRLVTVEILQLLLSQPLMQNSTPI
jgi:hypothetical protein